MAQKTAVQWLIDEILMPEYGHLPEWVIDKVNEAKAMEKEQIENAFNQGFSTPQWDKSKENKAEQYYNENFKSNQNETETN